MRLWILVANRSGAKLFEKANRNAPPLLLSRFDHPAGRLKNREVDADRPGRTFDRHGAGRHAMSHEQDPTQHLAEDFARQLAKELQRATHEDSFDGLVLIAEPRFLGHLRQHLTAPTSVRVIAEVPKDVPDPDAAVVNRYVEELAA